MHWNFTDDAQTVSINLSENSNNGTVWGTVTYNNVSFPVAGYWQALKGGGCEHRKVSNFQLSGMGGTSATPDFVAMSGVIQGTAPNMGPFDLSVSSASSGTGALNQTQAHLATPLQEAAPGQLAALPPGGTDMPWNLSSLDGTVVMDAMVGGDGVVSGTLSVASGDTFTISGHWAASQPAQGRPASAFEFLGRHTVATCPGNLLAEDLLAAAGIMTGLAHFPQKIDISGNIASISEYVNTPFQTQLLPMLNTDQTQLAAAYAESYMVIQMGGTGGDAEAVSGWSGPEDSSQSVSPFGNGDYKSAGTALSTDELADIAKPDPSLPDTNDIRIPVFKSAAGTRPVMIQFVGDADHFGQPPLEAYHEQITKIFYDQTVGALVLQFADQPGGQRSSQINFNHGHGSHSGRNHNSVIVEPR